jgi:3-oxoacyl-[acyl-carrier-protein] synthase-3
MLLRLAEAPDKIGFMNEVLADGLDGKIDSTLTVSDLALEASQMALRNAGVTIQEIDCIIDSSTVPDFAYPHTGCVLQGKFGLTSTPAFNLQQGCAGFIYGLAMGDQFIRTGLYERILVVGAELISSMFDYTDRGRDMAVLFADGAGAVVLEAVEGGASGLISHHLHTDGTILEALAGEVYGSSTYPIVSKKKIEEDRARPRMNGRQVFVHAVRRFREVIAECLEVNRLTVSEVDLFIFHQANIRIIEAVADALKIPLERS